MLLIMAATYHTMHSPIALTNVFSPWPIFPFTQPKPSQAKPRRINATTAVSASKEWPTNKTKHIAGIVLVVNGPPKATKQTKQSKARQSKAKQSKAKGEGKASEGETQTDRHTAIDTEGLTQTNT